MGTARFVAWVIGALLVAVILHEGMGRAFPVLRGPLTAGYDAATIVGVEAVAAGVFVGLVGLCSRRRPVLACGLATSAVFAFEAAVGARTHLAGLGFSQLPTFAGALGAVLVLFGVAVGHRGCPP